MDVVLVVNGFSDVVGVRHVRNVLYLLDLGQVDHCFQDYLIESERKYLETVDCPLLVLVQRNKRLDLHRIVQLFSLAINVFHTPVSYTMT